MVNETGPQVRVGELGQRSKVRGLAGVDLTIYAVLTSAYVVWSFERRRL